jgi:mono/diheme cytochrome c family protein
MTTGLRPSYAACRFALGALALLASAATTSADDSFEKVAAPFLKQHCVACHGEKKQEGGVRFDGVDGINAGNRNLWTMAHQKVAAGEMPPKGAKQPSDAEKKAMLTWVAAKQRALGASGTRRLNRRELAAALRDVTGLDVDFALGLPGDGTVAGFDTGADGLPEASDAVAQWLVVTRRAVDGLYFLDAPKGKTFALDFAEVKDVRKAFEAWKADGFTGGKVPGTPRPGLGLLIEARAVGEREEWSVTVPAPASKEGVLRLTLDVSAFKPLPGLPNPRLWVRIGGRDLDFREITGTRDAPQKLVYEVQLGDLVVQPKGVTIALANKVEIPYAVDGFENEDKTSANEKNPAPGGTGPFRPNFDRRALPPEKQPIPFVMLHSISIEPNTVTQWPPKAWKADVGEVKDNREAAKRLLGLWMDRAWRRAVSDAEVAPFLKLYDKLRADGMAFDPALRAAFQSVLMSAHFRYHASPGHPDPVVAQYAIAGRLSFMFWGAPPDAELRKLAAAGKLRDPKVLDAQVDRLLADPRADAFVRPFVVQWLEMEQPITIAQVHINKQDFRFARYLKVSMRDETVAYVAQMLADNKPAAELVQSDWTMMNDALAIHYGYPALEGGHLRKVRLRADDPRGGGVLGHAGIQSMLCWMGENWVIYRGAWTLRHVLDMPPPPPPLEVPELNPSDARNKGKPPRELLRQHQLDARCSVCHKNIDPLGFAYQNFDLSGRWRDVEYETYKRGELDGRIAWAGEGKSRPVDATGRLPRGEEFKTFAEFKALVAKNYRDDLVRGLLKNFFVYGTGRVPGIDDTAEITAIMGALRAKGYPVRDLLKAVVRSPAFLEQYDIIAK